MGGHESRHEVRYVYEDYTAKILKESQRLEEQRLAEERRQREIEELNRIEKERQALIEYERQCYLAEQDQIRLAEKESERIENQRIEEERKKQRQLNSKATESRRSLLSYRLGDKTGSQQVKTLDLNKLRIGVFGPTGSGKSCFINTCERAVRQTNKGSVPTATSGSEGTIILEDYLPEMFFRLVDTRGFFSYDHHEGKEMNDILYGRIKSGDFIGRGKAEPNFKRSSEDAALEDWLHGIILVLKANDIRLRNGSLEMYLKPVRDIVQAIGISPVTVVTHRDTLKTDAACDQALQLASAATGSSTSHTFFVANYCENDTKRNVDTELQIFDILHFAILTAEKYVENAKKKRIEQIEGEIRKALRGNILRTPNAIVPQAPTNVFLAVMQRKYGWCCQTVSTLSNDLNEQDVTTLELLASCWIEINHLFPLYMSKIVEEDLKRMQMI